MNKKKENFITYPKSIVLASQSIKRKEILQSIGLNFLVEKSTLKEYTEKDFSNIHTLVVKNAELKATNIQQKHPLSIIIGVDTLVLCNHKIIGKISNEKDGFQVFKSYFSHQSFKVISGLAVSFPHLNQVLSAYESTEIKPYSCHEKILKQYFQLLFSKEKSGGFSLENQGGILFDRINGSFYNVLGLPLNTLFSLFLQVNINFLNYLTPLNNESC